MCVKKVVIMADDVMPNTDIEKLREAPIKQLYKVAGEIKILIKKSKQTTQDLLTNLADVQDLIADRTNTTEKQGEKNIPQLEFGNCLRTKAGIQCPHCQKFKQGPLKWAKHVKACLNKINKKAKLSELAVVSSKKIVCADCNQDYGRLYNFERHLVGGICPDKFEKFEKKCFSQLNSLILDIDLIQKLNNTVTANRPSRKYPGRKVPERYNNILRRTQVLLDLGQLLKDYRLAHNQAILLLRNQKSIQVQTSQLNEIKNAIFTHKCITKKIFDEYIESFEQTFSQFIQSFDGGQSIESNEIYKQLSKAVIDMTAASQNVDGKDVSPPFVPLRTRKRLRK